MNSIEPTAGQWTSKGFVIAGFFIVILFIGGLASWAVMAKLDSAVIASAELRVESNGKSVAHLTGGVVKAILTKEGDPVKAGQVLLRLDATLHESERAIISGQIHALQAEQARLQAERDNTDLIHFPPELLKEAESSGELLHVLNNQKKLFQARREGFHKTIEQLKSRISQYQNQIDSSGFLMAAATAQQKLAQLSLDRHQALLTQGYSTAEQVEEALYQEAQAKGEAGAQTAEMARLEGQIEETRLQIITTQQSRHEQILTELSDTANRINELRERHIVVSDSLSKAELLSPQDGVVQSLSVHAPGAVLQPHEPALTIIPVADRLVLEARVPAVERDALYQGQAARVLFPSFNQRTTPEINGTVSHISADRLLDPQSGQSFYQVTLAISEEEKARLGADIRLAPGLPAEVYINTGSRSAFSYFFKPVQDNWHKAFKEE